MRFEREARSGGFLLSTREYMPSVGRRAATLVGLLALLMVMAFGGVAKAEVVSNADFAPQIWSDKPDYAPGELVTLAGSQWQPNESVHIYVNDDTGSTWSRNVDVTADAAGNLTDSFNLPDWFVAQYSVKATGSTGSVATTSFTDGNVKALASGVPSFTVSFVKDTTSSTCAGAGSTLQTATVTSDANNTFSQGANANDSVKLVAPGTVAGKSFAGWSSATAFTRLSQDGREICVSGAQGSITKTVTATYETTDAAPPTTTATATVAGGGSYSDGTWTNQNVAVKLDAADNAGGTGVKSITYSATGAQTISSTTVQASTASLAPITSEGTTTITYSATDNAGNAEPAKTFVVKVDKTAPQISASAVRLTGATPAPAYTENAWTNDSVRVSFACADTGTITSGVKTDTVAGRDVTDDFDGTVTSAGDCVDEAGNAAAAASFGVKVDKTKPTVEITKDPTAEWSNGDVVITATASDGGSGVDAGSLACQDGDTAVTLTDGKATISSEGTHTVTCSVRDNAGNSGEGSKSVKIDKTAPTTPAATFAPAAPADAQGGWYKDTVTVSYGGSTDPALADGTPGSGGISYSPAETFSTSGTHAYQGTATDQAGNASDVTGSVKVDATAPALSVVGCPTDDVRLGSSRSITVTASDAESGLAVNPAGIVALDTASIGQKTKTIVATDNVGHTKEVPCTYRVTYNWNGFYQPIDNNGVWNSVKAGSAIPVKFSLDGAPVPNSNTGQGLDVLSTAKPPTFVAVTCPSTGAVADVVEETTTSTAGLKWDGVADQYVYVWKTTTAMAGKCGRFELTLKDGTAAKTANFQFTK